MLLLLLLLMMMMMMMMMHLGFKRALFADEAQLKVTVQVDGTARVQLEGGHKSSLDDEQIFR